MSVLRIIDQKIIRITDDGVALLRGLLLDSGEENSGQFSGENKILFEEYEGLSGESEGFSEDNVHIRE